MKLYRILTYEGPSEWVERQPFNQMNQVQDVVTFGPADCEAKITSTWATEPETVAVLLTPDEVAAIQVAANRTRALFSATESAILDGVLQKVTSSS